MARLIDPVEHVKRTGDEELGYVPQREMVRRQDQAARLDAQSDRTQRFYNFETLERYYFNVPANSNLNMSDIMVASASTIVLLGITDDVPQQCRVTSIRIKSTEAITAGTLVPELRVTSGGTTTTYSFSECELSPGGNPWIASAVFDFTSAIQVEKDSAWALYVNTSAAFLPTTADIKVNITFCYDQWTPS